MDQKWGLSLTLAFYDSTEIPFRASLSATEGVDASSLEQQAFPKPQLGHGPQGKEIC